ncbi:serine/threonine protein kinase [Pokkaliibacter plantistimulans]|uniref:Serine/threonine protein kinase n=1 Tax=Pokkaliibacter plantistimulans TaxID=1635171 RepID=A0ABX5LZQ1_9GAMM|nr:protein kinase [Pokkaliibacter plantistimulans]PXF30903.1 serine/threonine protein kinase [Pokkaliibacter plantistimulans]
MPTQPILQQFYINEEQSLYLMSHQDAQKIKDWVRLCMEQLEQLGFSDIEFIGKGAYGFVFGGRSGGGTDYVFKFSRINLPQHVQDRLEEEAWMQSQVSHRFIPAVSEYSKIRKQSVLIMERAQGEDLEQYLLKAGRLSPRLVVRIAAQLADVLKALRQFKRAGESAPVVHGDIKPSNIVFDPVSEEIRLIDWGSSVFAQLDESGQPVGGGAFGMLGQDMQHTNAKLGDVYFIGDEQLNGGLSSPRFDEQGVAGTLYALASGQSCRYGFRAIPATSLGLPKEFALMLQAMLAGDFTSRTQAGDYFLRNMQYMSKLVLPDLPSTAEKPLIPIWSYDQDRDIDTVVYSSRKSFLREENADHYLAAVNDVELEKYYKNFMHGMGDTERALLAAVSRLGKFPIVGGLAIRWEESGVFIDSSLNLYNKALKHSFIIAVNNMVTLARAIRRVGVFKCCMFNARVTQHVERASEQDIFHPLPGMHIPYEVHTAPQVEDKSRNHSYFEDGQDPDEFLQLPQEIMREIAYLNEIHHTGLLIFEALPTHLKIHSYYVLLDKQREQDFAGALQRILSCIPLIRGLGVSGFMKMPYKNTRQLQHQDALAENFYPRDPRERLAS